MSVTGSSAPQPVRSARSYRWVAKFSSTYWKVEGGKLPNLPRHPSLSSLFDEIGW
jgi:hypothetical protein